MKKIIFAIVGAALLFFGAVDYIDYAAGAFMNYNRSLLIAGLVILAVVGVLHLRDWLHDRFLRKSNLPFVALAIAVFGATDVCAAGIHDVLIPPDVTPMVRNPFAPTGTEVWIAIGIFVVVGMACLLAQKFLRGREDRPQSKEVIV
ncbi:MAG: hypothetical protein WC643_04270 [Parcubacteria group bacterium]